LLFIYPTVYATNILAVGGLNLVILHYVDGTIYLVSKLCFYCLQLSILWYFEPKWAPPGDNRLLVAKRAGLMPPAGPGDRHADDAAAAVDVDVPAVATQ